MVTVMIKMMIISKFPILNTLLCTITCVNVSCDKSWICLGIIIHEITYTLWHFLILPNKTWHIKIWVHYLIVVPDLTFCAFCFNQIKNLEVIHIFTNPLLDCCTHTNTYICKRFLQKGKFNSHTAKSIDNFRLHL